MYTLSLKFLITVDTTESHKIVTDTEHLEKAEYFGDLPAVE